MGRKFRNDCSVLSKVDATHVSLASGAYLTIGGQQYSTTSALTLNTATVGAGGLDTGALGVHQTWYVHAVVVGGVLYLVASLSKIAPTGFTTFVWTGWVFVTDFNSTVAITANSTIWDSIVYDLVIGATTTAPTYGSIVDNLAMFRRNGEVMEISFQFYQSTAGVQGSGIYLFPIPSGFLIDITKHITAGDSHRSCVGSASGFSSGGLEGFCNAYTTTTLNMALSRPNDVVNSPVTDSHFGLGTSTTTYDFIARIPIVGWSANVL